MENTVVRVMMIAGRQVAAVLVLCALFVHAEHLDIATKSSGPIEVCQWKAFNETCPTGTVIVIEHALYGRMRLGRCIDRDYGHQGCSVSVQSYVERRCAGRRQCQLSLPDEYLDQLKKPCPTDLKSYLEVAYHCVRVETAVDQACRGFEAVRVSRPSGYLSNFATEETSKGSEACPWVIEGQPGQRFTVTLIDFGVWSLDGDQSRLPVKTGLCHIYAEIRELAVGHGGVVICGLEHREQVVYTSETNVVQIEMMNPKTTPNPAYFLLKYEITGCADYIPSSSGAVVERHSDRTTVRCPQDQLAFELRCEVDRWTGRTYNCSEEWPSASIWNIGGILATPGSLTKNFVAMVISTIAVLVALGILVIGIFFIRRRRTNRRHMRRLKLLNCGPRGSMAGPDNSKSGVTSDQAYMSYKEQYPMLLKADGSGVAKGRESDYTATLPRSHQQTTVSSLQTTTSVHVTIGSSRLAHDTPDFYCFPTAAEDASFPAGGSSFPAGASTADDLYSLSSGTTGNRDDHIYESPKFFRRGTSDDDEAVQGALYHELDHQAFTARWTSIP